MNNTLIKTNSNVTVASVAGTIIIGGTISGTGTGVGTGMGGTITSIGVTG